MSIALAAVDNVNPPAPTVLKVVEFICVAFISLEPVPSCFIIAVIVVPAPMLLIVHVVTLSSSVIEKTLPSCTSSVSVLDVKLVPESEVVAISSLKSLATNFVNSWSLISKAAAGLPNSSNVFDVVAFASNCVCALELNVLIY